MYAAATGFGQDGPWAARPAFDEVIQASSGFASAMGSDDEPAFVPSLVADKICGLTLVGAVSAALVHRESTGKGQMVEVPMLETITAFNSIEMLGGHAFDPPIGPAGYKRMKERRPVRTKDGWLTMLPYSGENWCIFFEAVGHPECIEQFAVKDSVARAQNIDQIYNKMAEIAITRTTAEWEELLLRIDVPHAAFAKITEIAEQPHLKAVGMIATLDHPSEGKIRQARPSARFSDTRRRSAACLPGLASIRERFARGRLYRGGRGFHDRKESGWDFRLNPPPALLQWQTGMHRCRSRNSTSRTRRYSAFRRAPMALRPTNHKEGGLLFEAGQALGLEPANHRVDAFIRISEPGVEFAPARPRSCKLKSDLAHR